jgi:hypothetical protein
LPDSRPGSRPASSSSSSARSTCSTARWPGRPGTASKLGAFLDSVFDRWGEGIVYVGIVAGCVAAGYQEGAILAAAAPDVGVHGQLRPRQVEGLGFTEGTGMAAVGLAPREVRLVILTVGLCGPASPAGSRPSRPALA